MKIRNLHATKEIRRGLRSNMTLAEKILWLELRRNRDQYPKLRRQVGVGTFIADFLHPQSKLVIELDGLIHFTPQEQIRDALRTSWLESEGYHVLRFPNHRVYEDVRTVLEEIKDRIQEIVSTQNIKRI